MSANIGQNGYQELNQTNLQNAIDTQFGAGKATVIDNGDGTFTVSFIGSKKDYNITSNGVENGINWNIAMKEAKAPENQTTTSKSIIGIGTDGKSVNMDLWEYSLMEDGTYGLNDSEALLGDATSRSAGYLGTYTEDGQIIGKVPTYISTDNGATFKPVTSMVHTFYNCENLVKAPVLPNTLVYMKVCFFKAYNLAECSAIPNNVIEASNTFRETNLERMPVLGNKLTNMQSMFYNCQNLKITSKIPDSVTNMRYTFWGCTSLRNAPNIPNNVTDMGSTFQNCSNLVSAPNIPEGVESLSATFRNCASLKNIPSYIPSSVTNMLQAFELCPNLEGEIQINASLSEAVVYQYNNRDYYDYDLCFNSGTGSNGSGILILKSSTCPAEVLTKIATQYAKVRLEE